VGGADPGKLSHRHRAAKPGQANCDFDLGLICEQLLPQTKLLGKQPLYIIYYFNQVGSSRTVKQARSILLVGGTSGHYLMS
jgi:hypothetical protein